MSEHLKEAQQINKNVLSMALLKNAQENHNFKDPTDGPVHKYSHSANQNRLILAIKSLANKNISIKFRFRERRTSLEM